MSSGGPPSQNWPVLPKPQAGAPPLTRATAPLCFAGFCLLCLILVATKTYPSAFDELEHISYAAYLQETGRILPEIADMRTLAVTDMTRWDDRANYLGHPSPFYLFIAPFLDRTLPPAQAILPPRLASASLIIAGVGLVLWAGRRHFAHHRLALPCFCLLVAACPKLHATAGQVTNDALAFLGGSLAYWGASAQAGIRKRWGLAAIALGLLFALWAKPNAGLAVGAFLAVFALLQRQRLGPLAAAMAAGALIGAIPYAFILHRYGALVPITVEQFGNVHQLGSYAAYWPAFLVTLAYTWCFAQTGTWPLTSVPAAATAGLVWAVLATAALGGWLARQRADTTAAIAAAAPLAFLILLPIHFWFSAAKLGFSLPAASFRYDLPIWPALAHAIAYAVMNAKHPWQRTAVAAISLSALAAGWLSPD